MGDKGVLPSEIDLDFEWPKTHVPTDEQIQTAITDIGKYTLIEILLERRIKELQRGRFRSLGRFIFRNPSWRDDQYWIERNELNVETVRELATDALTAL